MVTFRNRLFCEEYAKPVDYLDARKFQWVTVLHVVVVVLLANVVSVLFGGLDLSQPAPPWQAMFPAMQIRPTVGEQGYNAICPIALFFACIVLFVLASTGRPSYFFHPSSVPHERKSNGIALSYYTCVPLSIAALPMGAAVASWVHGGSGCWHVQAFFLFAISIGACIVLAWWLSLVRAVKRTMPQVPRRGVSVGVMVPLLWPFVGCVILVGIPLAVLSILILIASLG